MATSKETELVAHPDAVPADFMRLPLEVLGAIVYADQEKLSHLKNLIARSQHAEARCAKPPLRPLDDEKIAFGYLLALGEIVMHASRGIPPLNPEAQHPFSECLFDGVLR